MMKKKAYLLINRQIPYNKIQMDIAINLIGIKE